MDKFVEVRPQQSIVELLGATPALPPAGMRFVHCMSCLKSIDLQRERRGEIGMALCTLKLPIIFICPLCNRCASRHRRKGRHRLFVLRRITSSLQNEVVR